MKILEGIRKAPSFLAYLSVSFLVVAAGEARADLNYTTNNGALTVESYTGTNTVVDIPATFNGQPVVSLGDAAFEFGSVTSVTIPGSVTNIGQYVFEACGSLTNAPIPASVVSIGTGAFAGCAGLTSIIIPNSVTTLGGSAFATCSGATNIVLTTNITAIPADAFDNCSSLKSFTIPSEITSIGSEAFQGCSSLTNIVIPTNVTTLGSSAFSGAGLRSITIPDSVTSIGTFEFDYCSYLMAINVDPANPNYSSVGGVLFDKSQDTLIAFPGGVTGSYTIPGTVAAIGNNAFEDCADLYTVTIPPSVTSIGSYAFSGCTDLQSIYCQGNAPSFSFDVFDNVSPAAAVYYLPGTTGWTSTFASLPTKIQNAPPQISAIAIQNKLFSFTCTSSSNQVAIVQACTNLANPTWVPVQTNILTGASFNFTDSQSQDYSQRFYRVSIP